MLEIEFCVLKKLEPPPSKNTFLRHCKWLISTRINVLVYVIGGSIVLFGKNRVLKLAVVNKIV